MKTKNIIFVFPKRANICSAEKAIGHSIFRYIIGKNRKYIPIKLGDKNPAAFAHHLFTINKKILLAAKIEFYETRWAIGYDESNSTIVLKIDRTGFKQIEQKNTIAIPYHDGDNFLPLTKVSRSTIYFPGEYSVKDKTIFIKLKKENYEFRD